MNDIFIGVVGQYIDSNGKARVLNYKTKDNEEISLVISPIPPLNVSVKNKKDIKEVSLQSALNFIKNKSFQITDQEAITGSKKGIRGIWIETKEKNSGIYYGYIPLIDTQKIISGVSFSTRIDPIRTDNKEESELTLFRKNRKIAEILKQYVLYTYALHPDDFGEEYFVVDPDHTYDIKKLNKRLFVDGNDVIYRAGYIIVTSQEIKEGLLSFLKTSLLNDKPGVMKILESETIENYYQTISDFRSSNDQLIFVNKSGLKRWKNSLSKKTNGPIVSSFPVPDTKSPYYYKNPKIRKDELMILQNVNGGGFEEAVSLSYKWSMNKINTGWETQKSNIIDDISYIICSEMGEIEREKKKTNYVSVFQYENGEYAALLYFV